MDVASRAALERIMADKGAGWHTVALYLACDPRTVSTHVIRILESLEGQGLVRAVSDTWIITPAGEQALAEARASDF